MPGEYPTLGFQVADWIEANLVVPDGPHVGQPFRLTDEQIRYLLRHYRLDLSGKFTYRGSQLVRSQGWGKDPLLAAFAIAEGLGPVLFDGWDARGEPVGKPWATPWIQVAGVSGDQALGNTFRPIVTMLTEGPLCDLDGLDVGETRVNLPSGGRIEPVASSADSRLGARLTFCGMGETHLWFEVGGGVTLAANLKRNLAKMGGRWAEISNAFDPSQRSVAQRTYEARAKDVLLDWRTAPDPSISLANRAEVRKALRYCYGDSAKVGDRGWVDLDRIIAEINDPSTSPSDARRFFLSIVTVGDRDLVDPLAWDAAAHPDEPLAPKTPITLGFDGSKTQDCTALVACRITDGRLFPLRIWERPADAPAGWRVPSLEVDTAVRLAYQAYDVRMLWADPFRWQDYIDRWAGEFPKRVMELPTNSEQRIDAAVTRFLVAFRAGELSHNGDPDLTRHVFACALAAGKRKAMRDEDTPDPTGESTHYLRPVKKRRSFHIDGAIAAILAYSARGWAIEHGALVPPAKAKPPRVW